ncbi:MAG: shikimate kinase [Patescibacteria group bacterium]
MKHIIIFGFKNVGKSTIGKELSIQINRPFIDLDEEVEKEYKAKFGLNSSCREIMQKYGKKFYYKLEKKTLNKIIKFKMPSIIALGGGTPLKEQCQNVLKKYIKNCIFIYITASKNVILKRIVANGKPAFFSDKEKISVCFQRLWKKREKQYRELAQYTVYNTKSIDNTINKLKEKIINLI